VWSKVDSRKLGAYTTSVPLSPPAIRLSPIQSSERIQASTWMSVHSIASGRGPYLAESSSVC